MSRIKIRRATRSEFFTTNPILADGEPALELDTSRFFIGDGATDFRSAEPFLSGKQMQKHVVDTEMRLGPLATDFTSVNIGVAGDGVTYNQQYIIGAGGVLPANWPVDTYEGLVFTAANVFLYSYGSQNIEAHTLRVMCDGDKFCWYGGAAAAGSPNPGYMVYIDGRPTSAAPYAVPGAANFNTIIFPNAKPRLIEVRSTTALSSVYTQKPYRLWKPPPRRGPRVLVLGDSYSAAVGSTNLMNGIYQNIGPAIGTEDVWLDTIGGTGYGVSADNSTAPGGNRYLDRLEKVLAGKTWDYESINPDMIVVHGGGANDLYKGRTVQQVITDATAFFQQARAKAPKAKLVFLEGFAPPGFNPAVFNPNYSAVRQGVQEAAQSAGVYYIDVATTDPWITGTGRVGATTGVGNSDIYVGADNVHLVDAGYLYIRGRLAPKLRRILRDTGELVNQLI